MTEKDGVEHPFGAEYGHQSVRDLACQINRLEPDFPNFADWPIALPAGHWRAILPILSALSTPPPVREGGEAVAYAKYWWEGSARLFRVDLTPVNEPWLEDLKPDVVPLYASPVPPGWKVVPVEPTQAMLDAGYEVYSSEPDHDMSDEIYAAMLAAAPRQALSQGGRDG